MRGLLLALLLAIVPQAVAAETLTTLLSTNRVEIHSTYSGAEIVVFGAIDFEGAAPPADGIQVAVTVTGPRGSIMVLRKARAGPIWINQQRVRFDRTPGYQAVLSSEPLAAIAGAGALKDLTLDPADDPESDRPPGELRKQFIPELVRLKQLAGLFRKDEAGISFVGNRLFQARIALPAKAPLGRYYVITHAFSAGKAIARSENEFFLTKSGFEAYVAREARDRPWSYGLAAVLCALGLGWLASVAFRRD